MLQAQTSTKKPTSSRVAPPSTRLTLDVALGLSPPARSSRWGSRATTSSGGERIDWISIAIGTPLAALLSIAGVSTGYAAGLALALFVTNEPLGGVIGYDLNNYGVPAVAAIASGAFITTVITLPFAGFRAPLVGLGAGAMAAALIGAGSTLMLVNNRFEIVDAQPASFVMLGLIGTAPILTGVAAAGLTAVLVTPIVEEYE